MVLHCGGQYINITGRSQESKFRSQEFEEWWSWTTKTRRHKEKQTLVTRARQSRLSGWP